jgi:FAD/FMN-containing dehydrogenase
MATTAPPPAAFGLSALQGDFAGDVLTPGNRGYYADRHNFQGLHDRRLAVIVLCGGAADVIAALGFARGYGLEVANRGGGHSVHGYSSSSGIVIDMRGRKGIRVRPEARTRRLRPALPGASSTRRRRPSGSPPPVAGS